MGEAYLDVVVAVLVCHRHGDAVDVEFNSSHTYPNGSIQYCPHHGGSDDQPVLV
jgi:hypothetical protein